MKTVSKVTLALLTGAIVLASCDSRETDSTKASLRIAGLEDSLAVYRDSLRDVQRMGWTFNTLLCVVKLTSDEVKLGDTCEMEVFIAGGNDNHKYFRHESPTLQVTGEIGADTRTIVEKNERAGWRVKFVPSKAGLDSITGRILVPDQRGYSDTTDLPFGAYINVKPR